MHPIYDITLTVKNLQNKEEVSGTISSTKYESLVELYKTLVQILEDKQLNP